MNDFSIAAVLQRLDTEIFYGILDVALDLDGGLAVCDERTVRIDCTRP